MKENEPKFICYKRLILCIFIYRSYDIYKEKYVTFENFELRKLIMCTTFLLVLVYVNPF